MQKNGIKKSFELRRNPTPAVFDLNEIINSI